MKKFIITLSIAVSIAMMAVTNALAMSTSTIREHARFITDRMAYELDMTPRQYEDCYEINYDFIYAINPIMKDVANGYNYAIDRYYEYLDYRNDDLRYILTTRQFTQFLSLEYFYRPVYAYRGDWYFRVYQIYNNRKFFYFDAPTIYRTYAGAHSRSHHTTGYYGNNRYSHTIAPKYASLRSDKNYSTHARNDFGHNRRDDKTHQSTNGYNNRNQDNREHDSRYNDERKGKNQNTPEINNRNQGHGSQSNSSNGHSSQSNGNGHSSQSNGNGHGSQNNGSNSHGSQSNSSNGHSSQNSSNHGSQSNSQPKGSGHNH